MTGAQMKVAKLDRSRLRKLQTLEKEIGCCLVALEPKSCLANLTQTQVKRLKAGEKELGVLLLAYEPQ